MKGEEREVGCEEQRRNGIERRLTSLGNHSDLLLAIAEEEELESGKG